MSQLNLVLFALIVADIATIYICRKISTANEDRKFLIVVVIIATLICVEYPPFMYYVMSKLRYLDFTFSTTRDSFKDVLFFASGFIPAFLLALTKVLMDKIVSIEWKKIASLLKR